MSWFKQQILELQMMYTSILHYGTTKWEEASDEGNKSCVKFLWENNLLASITYTINKMPNQLQKQNVTSDYSCHILMKGEHEKKPS